MTRELARLRVRDLAGVFAARRLGRELAAGLSLEHQDQVRVATALSEVSRSAVTIGQTADIAFGADEASLVLTVTVDGDACRRRHRGGRPPDGHRRDQRAGRPDD